MTEAVRERHRFLKKNILQDHPFLQAVLFNALLLAFLLLLSFPSFETNDDYGTMELVSGIKGSSM